MNKAIFIFAIVLVFLFSADIIFAGFGISSPYVRNENLTQGSHYEKKVTIVRGDPIEDLKAEITINVPGADEWFSIDRGREFILPKGEKQIPIIVSVDVPKDADFKDYQGTIIVRTSSLEGPEGGTVSIALGTQIDVDLNVSKQEIFDFKVWGVGIFDLEEGHKVWFLYFPGKIKFSMKIENLGNIKASPTKIHFDIYDSQEKQLLESLETAKMEKVDSFETKEIIAELLTKLAPGSYWAQFKIFKNEEVINEGKIHLSILPYETIPGYKGAGILDLDIRDKAIIIILTLLTLSIVGYTGKKGYKFLNKAKLEPKKIEIQEKEPEVEKKKKGAKKEELKVKKKKLKIRKSNIKEKKPKNKKEQPKIKKKKKITKS